MNFRDYVPLTVNSCTLVAATRRHDGNQTGYFHSILRILGSNVSTSEMIDFFRVLHGKVHVIVRARRHCTFSFMP